MSPWDDPRAHLRARASADAPARATGRPGSPWLQTATVLVVLLAMQLVLVATASATNFPAAPTATTVLGAPNFVTPTEGTRYDRSLQTPEDVEIDSAGRLLIADTGNPGRVVAFNTIPATDDAPFDYAIGTNSTNDYYAGCSPTANGFSGAVSAGGGRAAVVVRWVSRVVLYNSEPTASGAAADIALGQPDLYTCPWTSPAATAASLDDPQGVWTNGTKVAVADSGHNRVLIWNTWPTSHNQPADLVLGQPDMTSSAVNNGGISGSSMNTPRGIWSDGTKLLVADGMNHRVLVWNSWPTTNGQTANFVIGQPNLTSNATGCSAAGFGEADDVTSNGTKIAIASSWDNNRVLLYNSWPVANGASASVILGQVDTFTCDDPQSKSVVDAQSLSIPTGIAMSSDGTKLAVSDHNDNRVLVWTSWPTATQQAADRVIGHANFADAGANDQKLESVFDQTWDASVFQDGTSAYPFLAANGHLWISSGFNTLLGYNANPTVNNVPPALQLGQRSNAYNYAQPFNWGLGSTNVHSPHAIWTDGTRMAVADTGYNRVKIWTTYPTSMNQPPDLVLGQSSFVGGAPATSAAGMDRPIGVTSDGTKLVVTDAGNNRTLIWSTWPTVSGQAADLVLGQPDMTSGGVNNGGVSERSMSWPTGVSMADGKLAVADTNNNRILVWNRFPAANRAAASTVYGQASFTTSAATTITTPKSVVLADDTLMFTSSCFAGYLDPVPRGVVASGATVFDPDCTDPVPAANTVHQPVGVTMSQGTVWLADSGHGRVLRFNDTTAPTITSGPTLTATCAGATVRWRTSESTTTELHWGTTSQATPAAYTNHDVVTTITGLDHNRALTGLTPGTTYYYRVQAKDGAGTAVTSSEGSFTHLGCPDTAFADNRDAQPGSANATTIYTATPKLSWINRAAGAVDRQRTQVVTLPGDDDAGLWHLDGAASDSSATANPMVLGGGAAAPTYVAGQTGFGQALSFDGGDHACATSDAAYELDSFTASTWFSTSSIAGSAYPSLLARDSTTGNTRHFDIYFDRALNTLNASMGTSENHPGYVVSTPAGPVVNGAWHHVAMVAESDGTIRLYVDGALRSSIATAGIPSVVGQQLCVGRREPGEATSPFTGQIDDVRLSPVPMTATQIAGYYATTAPAAQVMWDSDTTDTGIALAGCAVGIRCADVVYGSTGAAMPLTMSNARYYVRSKFRATGGGAWSSWALWDWFQTQPPPSLTVTLDSSSLALGYLVAGTDAVVQNDVTVSTTNVNGYTLTAKDESDTWGADEAATWFLPDWTGTDAVPAVWAAGTPGYMGVTVRAATGGRLAKWGPAGSYPATDFANNLYAGLRSTTSTLLHQSAAATGAGGDVVSVAVRANVASSQVSGAYDATITYTATGAP